MTEPTDFWRKVRDIAKETVAEALERPTGVAPGAYSWGTVDRYGRVVHASDAGGALLALAYMNTFGGTTVPSSGNLRLNYDDVEYDPSGIITTGASWACTLPADGRYRIEINVEFGSGADDFTAGDGYLLRLYNGAAVYNKHIDKHFITAGEEGEVCIMHGSMVFSGIAGQTINARLTTLSAVTTHQIFAGDGAFIAIYQL